VRLRAFVWTLLAVAHLVVVVGGASNTLPQRSSGMPGETLRSYARVSGADSEYGFFAPAVGAEQRARFVLMDADGFTWSDSLDEAKNPEARLRLMNIVEHPFMSGAAAELPAWREQLVKSWAANMFSRHPRAVSLTVIVEAYAVPTMAEFRAGQTPNWMTVYVAQLQRAPSLAHERAQP